ncbi:MAG: pyridoxine 5'-phosphate synthase [Spirochaetes bacterium]|nr:pyridoxine 5'-phosphate synthase [Spirochaetota bacterium]
MTNLSVNLNKVALLRNTRTIGIPSVVRAAEISIEAGANGITVHPRPDQRHIKPSDVYDLKDMLTVEFNIEGNPFFPEFMKIVRKVKPDQCTLVPDTENAFTSDHGWDLSKDSERVRPVIKELQDMGIRVSLFMDADPDLMEMAKEAGTDRIELYTEPYAAAFREGNVEPVFQQFANAAKKANELGLGINGGHDLSLQNLGKFCTIPGILEVSIGHALIAEALEMGLYNTVKEYLKILSECNIVS